jgi:hypothetical protein
MGVGLKVLTTVGDRVLGVGVGLNVFDSSLDFSVDPLSPLSPLNPSCLTFLPGWPLPDDPKILRFFGKASSVGFEVIGAIVGCNVNSSVGLNDLGVGVGLNVRTYSKICLLDCDSTFLKDDSIFSAALL